MPVTTPLTIEAIDGLLEVHVPPVTGESEVVLPTQIVLLPLLNTVGRDNTVMSSVGNDVHPVVLLVKEKFTVPSLNPDTSPSLLTVAMDVLLLDQTPSVVGDNVVIVPGQIEVAPDIVTNGISITVTSGVAIEEHPVAASVNLNEVAPGAIPVTNPSLVTVTTPMPLKPDFHVPPVEGLNVVVPFTQMDWLPVIITDGVSCTTIGPTVLNVQPPDVVNVKLALPGPTAVTIPSLVTVAIVLSLLTQIPPLDGIK